MGCSAKPMWMISMWYAVSAPGYYMWWSVNAQKREVLLKMCLTGVPQIRQFVWAGWRYTRFSATVHQGEWGQ